MKILKLKYLLLIDLILLILFVASIIFGQAVWEAIHNYPNKSIYINMKNDPQNPITITQSVKEAHPSNGITQLSEADQNNISAFDQKFVTNAKTLYGLELNNNESDIAQIEKIANNLEQQRIISGNATYLGTHIGELIKQKTNAKWAYDKSKNYLVLTNKDGKLSFNIVDFIFLYPNDDGTTLQAYYDKAIKEIGEK